MAPAPDGPGVLIVPCGSRVPPFPGEENPPPATACAAPDGTPILAAADGLVTVAEFSGGYGGLIVIEHTIDGQTVATAYAHMWQHGIHVHAGDRVSAGQHIGDVGSSGMSTGAHLHFEVRPAGTGAEAIDAAAWLNQHGAANLPTATSGPPAACHTPSPKAAAAGPTQKASSSQSGFGSTMRPATYQVMMSATTA